MFKSSRPTASTVGYTRTAKRVATVRTAFLLLMLLMTPVVTMADPYRESATGLEFPDRIHIFKTSDAVLERSRVAAFDDPRLGIGITYSYLGGVVMQATIYIYDQGVKDITDGLESNVTKESCSELSDKNILSAAGYADIVMAESDTEGLNHKLGSIPTCYISFTFIGSMNRKRNSYSYVTGYSSKIVKVRFTNLVEHSRIADFARQNLLKHLGDQMQSR